MAGAWSVQDAKARFSELLETCLKRGPQLVTKREVEAALLVPKSDGDQLQRAAPPSLKELVLAPAPRAELEAPPRGRLRRRRVAALD